MSRPRRERGPRAGRRTGRLVLIWRIGPDLDSDWELGDPVQPRDQVWTRVIAGRKLTRGWHRRARRDSGPIVSRPQGRPPRQVRYPDMQPLPPHLRWGQR